tara:strand:- start:341 stop:811 length:471 start_codon:yes stop_codon:yes gene_type:complete
MPITIPDELADIGAERDALMADAAEAIIPPAESPYNVKAMEALSDALKKIAAVLGVELEVEEYTEATTVLDPQVQQFLLMIDRAAEDYGSPLPVDLEALKSDAELTTITAALLELAADDGFAEFLAGEPEDGDQVDIEISGPGPAADEDFDFAGRM